MKKIKEDGWIQKQWRPMMAIVYMIIIVCDFIFFPVFWSLVQAFAEGLVSLQWSPLTLLSGGIFHAAMGAVLGVAAWTRGQEKIERLKSHYEEGNEYDGQ
jgi:hypothetical protein